MAVDEIDDLSIAVDEAASLLLRAGAAKVRLDIELKLANAVFEATVSGDTIGDAWPPGGVEADLARRVLVTLTDDHSLETTGSVSRIRLIKETMTRG